MSNYIENVAKEVLVESEGKRQYNKDIWLWSVEV